MDTALIIHGRLSNRVFVADDPLPDFDGPAELIVYAPARGGERSGKSMFDVFGKARRLRSAEELDAQLREERAAWSEP